MTCKCRVYARNLDEKACNLFKLVTYKNILNSATKVNREICLRFASECKQIQTFCVEEKCGKLKRKKFLVYIGDFFNFSFNFSLSIIQLSSSYLSSSIKSFLRLHNSDNFSRSKTFRAILLKTFSHLLLAHMRCV